ncbi:MAG TPA: alpha/beta hydrolase, partial [Candidatus Binatia bacterium]|nr:alpha/beta hydrolase [Candidatus Binatia bacterium]
IIVGEDDRNQTSEINHRMSTDILAAGIPNNRCVVLKNERHSYFFTNPDEAHKAIREFLRD